MSYLVATRFSNEECNTVESNDVLYEQLLQHRDPKRFANTRIVVLSEGIDPNDSLVTDVRMDYVNAKQTIESFHVTGQVVQAESLYRRLNNSLSDILDPFSEVNTISGQFKTVTEE